MHHSPDHASPYHPARGFGKQKYRHRKYTMHWSDKADYCPDVPECGPNKARWYTYMHGEIQNGLIEHRVLVDPSFYALSEEEQYKVCYEFSTAPRTPLTGI